MRLPVPWAHTRVFAVHRIAIPRNAGLMLIAMTWRGWSGNLLNVPDGLVVAVRGRPAGRPYH